MKRLSKPVALVALLAAASVPSAFADDRIDCVSREGADPTYRIEISRERITMTETSAPDPEAVVWQREEAGIHSYLARGPGEPRGNERYVDYVRLDADGRRFPELPRKFGMRIEYSVYSVEFDSSWSAGEREYLCEKR